RRAVYARRRRRHMENRMDCARVRARQALRCRSPAHSDDPRPNADGPRRAVPVGVARCDARRTDRAARTDSRHRRVEVDHDPEGAVPAVQSESVTHRSRRGKPRETFRDVTQALLVEACVESLEEALAAERGGAGRLELCANMDVGGTTPGAELFRAVRARVGIAIAMMIRPRGGSFVYSNAELESMRRDLDLAAELGADVAVIGVLNDDSRVDSARTRELVARAGAMPVTFHKAFDVAADQERDLEVLIDAGVTR